MTSVTVTSTTSTTTYIPYHVLARHNYTEAETERELYGIWDIGYDIGYCWMLGMDMI